MNFIQIESHLRAAKERERSNGVLAKQTRPSQEKTLDLWDEAGDKAGRISNNIKTLRRAVFFANASAFKERNKGDQSFCLKKNEHVVRS